MTPEEEIINVLKNPQERGALKCLALDLITGDYDSLRLAELARQAGVTGRLGYLSEVAAIASERKGISGSRELYALATSLFSPRLEWQYLDPNMPGFAKRIFYSPPQQELNKRWRIWGVMAPEELEDWISLYDIKGKHEPKQDNQQTGSSVNY